MSDFVQQQGTRCAFTTSESWVILSPIEQSIKQKIEAVGTPLKDWDIQINYGIKTGFNDAFIVSTETRDNILQNCKTEEERIRTAELIRPILRGRDIKRYGYEWAGLWLINTHNGVKGQFPRIDINDYPSVKAHLDQYWDKIEKRADQGDTPYNLRNCAYVDDFNKPKIVWKRVGSILRFSYDDSRTFALDSTCFATGNHIEFLVCVMNSVIGRYMLRNAPQTGTGDLLISVQAIEPVRIPIPRDDQWYISQLGKLKNSYNPKEEEAILLAIGNLYGFTTQEIEFIESQCIQ
jgi:hypothetical protein